MVWTAVGHAESALKNWHKGVDTCVLAAKGSTRQSWRLLKCAFVAVAVREARVWSGTGQGAGSTG